MGGNIGSGSRSGKAARALGAFREAADNGFSGVALVRHRGEIVLHEAAGFADRALEIPNTIDTVFDIGSITKQFTAALILALQEAGSLSVRDGLADHLDDVPMDKAGITIHQLLTHTAGLADGFGGDDVPIDLETYLALMWATPLRFEPGTKHKYSNGGYSIAAAIVERVTGRSYEAALAAHVLAPAGLSATGYRLPDWSRHVRAIGYGEWGRRDQMSGWPEEGPWWNLRGNGGLLSTTSDLSAWHNALAANVVLGSDSVGALQGRHVDETFGRSDLGAQFYGYGWVTQDLPSGGVLHWHDGGNGYFHAFTGRVVEEGLVVVVLANESNRAAHDLADAVGRAVMEKS